MKPKEKEKDQKDQNLIIMDGAKERYIYHATGLNYLRKGWRLKILDIRIE